MERNYFQVTLLFTQLDAWLEIRGVPVPLSLSHYGVLFTSAQTLHKFTANCNSVVHVSN